MGGWHWDNWDVSLVDNSSQFGQEITQCLVCITISKVGSWGWPEPWSWSWGHMQIVDDGLLSWSQPHTLTSVTQGTISGLGILSTIHPLLILSPVCCWELYSWKAVVLCNCNHVCACLMACSLFTPDYKYLYLFSLSPPHNNSDRWPLGPWWAAYKHFIQILLARVGSLEWGIVGWTLKSDHVLHNADRKGFFHPTLRPGLII